MTLAELFKKACDWKDTGHKFNNGWSCRRMRLPKWEGTNSCCFSDSSNWEKSWAFCTEKDPANCKSRKLICTVFYCNAFENYVLKEGTEEEKAAFEELVKLNNYRKSLPRKEWYRLDKEESHNLALLEDK